MQPRTRSLSRTKEKGGKKLSPSSWGAMGIFSSCKNNQTVAAESKNKNKNGNNNNKRSIGISRSIKVSSVFRSSSRSNGNTSSRLFLIAPGDNASAAVSSSSSFNSATSVATVTTTASFSASSSSALSLPLSSTVGSIRAMQLRKLFSCYECHSVLDPWNLRSMFPCTDCNEVFMKAESLELHRATRHAELCGLPSLITVSELGSEDTSRNIVEIIFQSRWHRKHLSTCKFERILKVHSTEKAIQRFEHYRESIKERASKESRKNPRCVADGNELLRFHCTTFACSLGIAGATALCQMHSPHCSLCCIIRYGFRVEGEGKITMMATSRRAHDAARVTSDGEKMAMLVCRVVAGRVKKVNDSTSGNCECVSCSCSDSEGVSSDLDELYVFNPRAILPCFVLIYSAY